MARPDPSKNFMEDLPRRGASSPIRYCFPPGQFRLPALLRRGTVRYRIVCFVFFLSFFPPPRRYYYFCKWAPAPDLRFTLRITTGRFCPIVAACVVPQGAGTTSDAGVRTGNEFDTRTLDGMMDFYFPGVGDVPRSSMGLCGLVFSYQQDFAV